MKKRFLRTINSGTTLVLLILASGVPAILAMLLSTAVSKYLYIFAIMASMAVFMVIGHKVRRIAKVVYDLKNSANAIATKGNSGVQSAKPNTSSLKAESRLVDLDIQKLGEEVRQFREKHGLSQQNVLETLESISYSVASQIHPKLSAGSIREIADNAELVQPKSVSIVGNESTENLVSWLIANTYSGESVQIELIRHDVPIELALCEVLLIDTTRFTSSQCETFVFLGKSLPKAEVWIIGPNQNRLQIAYELTKTDSGLMNKIVRSGNRELSIMRKSDR